MTFSPLCGIIVTLNTIGVIILTNREMTCAAINDISGGGKCSLTIALPVLSACGVETSVLPTAVLSTHTGGFGEVVSRDLTPELLLMAEHWHRCGFHFTSIYSGFLASAEQIGMVEKIFELLKAEDTMILVDPVMGDNGKLYRTYTEEMASGMARLCRLADVIVPNMTEAAHLLGIEYTEPPYDRQAVKEILHGLCALGAKKAVLTGVSFNGEELGAACYDSTTGEMVFHLMPKISGSFHGTGDLFASALLGALQNGMSLSDGCALATEFTHRVIEYTAGLGGDRRFGVKFEHELPWLCEKLRK